MMKLTLIGMSIGLLAMMVASVDAGKPYTYGDFMADETRKCVARNGDGVWRGSMGLSLDEYCRGAAKALAVRDYRLEHPEKF